MRKPRVAAVLSVTTIALASVALVGPTTAGAHGGGGGDTTRVRMLDDCDPATFNAVLGPGVCVGDGETTFADFIEQLGENGFEANESVDDWEFKSDDFHIDHGDRIRAVNLGGEFHTFTKVEDFGGGCVEELNFGMEPVPECEEPEVFQTTGALPGDAVHVYGLAPGTHKFECLIHPWMQSVVEVRR